MLILFYAYEVCIVRRRVLIENTADERIQMNEKRFISKLKR